MLSAALFTTLTSLLLISTLRVRAFSQNKDEALTILVKLHLFIMLCGQLLDYFRINFSSPSL